MSEGFLGRWSRRKLDVTQGKPVEPQPPVADAAAVAPPQPSAPTASGDTGLASPSGEVEGTPAAGLPPAPTLEDARALTPESDFRRFAAADVAPEVKNAALKKLFADPRYNVMDRMDVYIDDYSRPDPLPESMLRQLAGAKFLGLFDAEAQEDTAGAAAGGARDVADNPQAETVAQSDPILPAAVPESPEHADPDLRLQQDHAAPGEDPGRGAG